MKFKATKKKEPVYAMEEAREHFGIISTERPSGALSINELCKGLGLGKTAMRERMTKAVADGVYEKLEFRTKDIRGNSYNLPVYRKVVKNAMDRIR